MDYEIVATLGPASQSPELWKAMLALGVSAFRLNTSHLTLEQLEPWLAALGSFLASAPQPAPWLVLDLQGSKWRLGEFPAFELVEGERVELVLAERSIEAGRLPVPHRDFFEAAGSSRGEVVLNDAKVALAVETAQAHRMVARVVRGGPIASAKGITYTASAFRQEKLSAKDEAIVAATRGFPGVRYALSYVRDAVEMAGYRARLGQELWLIAKLERPTALDQAPQIARLANELWLCRGDLGAEMGAAQMAKSVWEFSRQLSALDKPVFLAGQVLEHVSSHPSPTRSELCHLYEALRHGYRGVVLSDETAIGRYPLESCQAAGLFRAA